MRGADSQREETAHGRHLRHRRWPGRHGGLPEGDRSPFSTKANSKEKDFTSKQQGLGSCKENLFEVTIFAFLKDVYITSSLSLLKIE